MGGPAPTPGYGEPPLDVGGRLGPISIGIVIKNLVGSQIVIVVHAHHPPNGVVLGGSRGLCAYVRPAFLSLISK